MWLQKPKKKKVVLFLCTGDTCRGPMAAGYMRKVLEEKNVKNVEVRTAGVMTATGLLCTPEAVQLMEGAGIDIRRHRSTQLTPELIRKADIILGMTPFHVQFALRMSPDAKGKAHLFKEYTNCDTKNYQITDPMGHTLEVYKRVFREIRQACEYLADHTFVTDRKTETPKEPAAPKTGGKPAPIRRKASAPPKKKDKGSVSEARPPKEKARAVAAASKPSSPKGASSGSSTSRKPAAAKR